MTKHVLEQELRAGSRQITLFDDETGKIEKIVLAEPVKPTGWKSLAEAATAISEE